MGMLDDLLKKRLNEAEAPPDMPIGHYRFQVKEAPTRDDYDSGWSRLRYSCVPLEAQDDVDEDELNEYGALNTTTVPLTFFFSDDPDNERRNKQSHDDMSKFLTNDLGLDEELPTEEAMAQVQGLTFLGEVTLRADRNNPDRRYPEIRNTLPDAE